MRAGERAAGSPHGEGSDEHGEELHGVREVWWLEDSEIGMQSFDAFSK